MKKPLLNAFAPAAIILLSLPTALSGQQEELDRLRSELRPMLEELHEQFGGTLKTQLERELEKTDELFVSEKQQLRENLTLLFSADGTVDRTALLGRVTIAAMQDDEIADWAIRLAAEEGLVHPSEEVRLLSTLHLSLHQTPRARSAVPILFNVARSDTSVQVRKGAIRAIGRINPSDSTTIQSFRKLLSENCSQNGDLVAALAASLAEAGHRARAATPDLLECLDQWEGEKRKTALIWAIGQTADDPSATIPKLAQVVGANPNRLHFEAIQAAALISEKIPLEPDCGLRKPLARIRMRALEHENFWSNNGALESLTKAEEFLQRQNICPSGFWSKLHYYWNLLRSWPAYLQALFAYLLFWGFALLTWAFFPRVLANIAISWPLRELGSVFSKIPISPLFFLSAAVLGETHRAARAWLQYNKPALTKSFDAAFDARAMCVHFYPEDRNPFQKWEINAEDLPNFCFWIQGVGGAGKTTLAVHLANQWSEKPQSLWGRWVQLSVRVPILVSEDWQGNLLEYVRNRLSVDGKTPTVKMVRHLAGSKNLLLIVDGLSERREQERVVNEVHSCHQHWVFTRMIVTSRAHSHCSSTIQHYEVGPVPPEKLENFVGSYLQTSSKIPEVVEGIQDLAREKPVLSLFIVLAIDQYQKDRRIPDSKLGLIKAYLESIVPLGESKLAKEGFEVAARIAARYCIGESYAPGRYSHQALVQHMDVSDDHARGTLCSRSGEPIPAALIIEQLVESGLLEKTTPLFDTLIGFSNDPVAEFLLAEELLRSGNEASLKKFESRLAMDQDAGSGLGTALAEVKLHRTVFRKNTG